MSLLIKYAFKAVSSTLTSDFTVSSSVLLFVGAVFLSALGVFLVQRRRFASMIDKLPGPRANLLFGNMLNAGLIKAAGGREHSLQVLFQTLCGLEKLYRKGIYRLWFMTVPMVFVTNFSAMQKVTGSKYISDKSSFYKFFEIGVGTGLVTSNGVKHKNRRKMLDPVFHIQVIDRVMPLFNKNAVNAVQKIYEQLTGEHIHLNKIIAMYTLDTICETTMGVTINAQNEGCKDLRDAVEMLSVLAVEKVTRPWLWLDMIFKKTQRGIDTYKHLAVFHDFSRNVIRKRLEEIKNNQDHNFNKDNDEGGSKKKRLMFLDLLLEEHLRNDDFTLEDVAAEVDTFLVAGHDTSATSMTWTLYLIGQHPEVQRKVHDEMDEIFGVDLERDITAEDIRKMKYLECAFKEGMRLFPPAPIFGRRVAEDTTINGYLVPKDTELWLFVYALHRDETVFPDPEKYDPDRFLPENCKGRHPCAYLPFSAGTRNCIGQKFAIDEVKVLLATIFRHFRLESLQPRDQHPPSLTAILHPTKPVLVKFHKRRPSFTM